MEADYRRKVIQKHTWIIYELQNNSAKGIESESYVDKKGKSYIWVIYLLFFEVI